MRRPLQRSTKTPKPGFHATQSADPNQVVQVTLVLRRINPLTDQDVMDLASQPVASRKYLTLEELARRYGASQQDVDQVIAFAHENGLAVVDHNLAARTIRLSGTVAALQNAFGVDLKVYQNAEGTVSYRGRTGEIHLPEELTDIVQSVHGLDNRDQAKPHFRILSQARAKASGLNPFTANQVASAYSFPTNATGKNQTIALIELGGGYKTADLNQYFKQFSAKPTVSAVSVDSATNKPTGSANGPDGEVELDIEVAGTIASGAHIVVYFTTNTDKGFMDAITSAVHDIKNNPSVVSISWGGPESSWTAQSMDSFNDVFKDASMLGVTVLVASGDDGSTDGITDGKQHVDFPSSSPYVLACGGTQLVASGSTIKTEITWGGTANDGASGGGVSGHFPVPSYQTGKLPTGFSGRGVPDVAGDADPQTGYEVIVDG